MGRKQPIPRYRLHKPSGLARVILNGKHVYLGPYDSEESRSAYAKLIAEQFGNPLAAAPSSARGDAYPDVSVNEVLVRYLEYASSYYSQGGQPGKEYDAMTDAVIPLRTLFSHLPARDFGPLRLKAIQKHLVDLGRRCRTEINKQIERIRRIFGWAVSEELVPPTVHAALKQVASLRQGKTTAREAPRVLPVADVVVEATLPYLSPQVAAIVRIQRLCGARPSEILSMRPIDLDMSGDVWLFRPETHKNSWRKQARIIALGPVAQAAIRPFLDRAPEAYLFSPAEAEQWRNEQRALHRKPNRTTPVYPSELRARERRKATLRFRVLKLVKRPRYDVHSYRRAIKYAIARANRVRTREGENIALIPSWHPYQLRHSAATELRKRFGAEAVALGLGNSPDLVELYAERDLDKLRQLARETG